MALIGWAVPLMQSRQMRFKRKNGAYCYSGQMSPWALLRKSHMQFAAWTQLLKRCPAQSETLGRSCERGGNVCEDPVSLRQIVASGAIILLVEGFLKVGHIACLILRILPTASDCSCYIRCDYSPRQFRTCPWWNSKSWPHSLFLLKHCVVLTPE